MTKPAIGFIGLGVMGSAMVERLQAQESEVLCKQAAQLAKLKP